MLIPPTFDYFGDTVSAVCLIVVIFYSSFCWVNKYIPINYGKQLKSFFNFSFGKMSWFFFEVPNLVIAGWFMIQYSENLVNYIMILPFIIHYINRSIIYPMTLQNNTKPIPIEICLFAASFTTCNSYLQSKSILSVQESKFSDLLKWNVLLGYLVFIFGMYINIKSDRYLQSLKKNLSTANSKTGEKKNYVIPREGFFVYVSQANYFGEIVEWVGFAILQTHSQMPWLFAISTLSILSSRALESHKWYQQTFKEYPKERKAIIPFIL
ncbi:hypothetical protein ABPG74_022334 [Tetrahymena malaccensis]